MIIFSASHGDHTLTFRGLEDQELFYTEYQYDLSSHLA